MCSEGRQPRADIDDGLAVVHAQDGQQGCVDTRDSREACHQSNILLMKISILGINSNSRRQPSEIYNCVTASLSVDHFIRS